MKKISIVILDYRKASSVVENIGFLMAQKVSFDMEIIVVDNSVDKTNADVLREGIDKLKHLRTGLSAGALAKEEELENVVPKKTIKLIINTTNQGYTKGNNIGAQEATGDYIAIVNPDIHCRDENTFQALIDYLESHPEVGIVAPRQINPDGKTEMSVRAFPRLWVQIARRTFLRHLPFIKSVVAYDEMQHLDYDKPQPVQWLQSSFIVVRRDLWDQFGGFDEDYFIFMSDSEICWQCWKAGYKVMYLPEPVVYPDGVRCSAGGFLDFFKNWVIRQHFRDAWKYQMKHFWEKKLKIN